MKRFLYFTFTFLSALGVFALLPASAFAGPPNPDPIPLTQPDGTTFLARAWGDEWSNGMETAEGYSIVLDQTNGYWVYAVRSSLGTLTPAATPSGEPVAGRDAPPPSARHARPDVPNVPGRSSLRFSSAQNLAPANIGTQKVLVLLVSFANQGPVGTSAADWNAKYFGSTGSIKSYYAEASYNKLNLVPAAESYGTANDGVVGWLKLPYNHPNTGASTTDVNRKLVSDAIFAANPYVDFASFDTNHNGTLSSDELHIVTVIAGYEMSYGGSGSCSPRIWGQSWSLGWGNVAAPVVDGVKVASWDGGGYTQFGEWHCVTTQRPGHASTIGVPTHELGHDLDLPDLYDTDSTTNGLGNWDIMATGAWNSSAGFPGNSPAHPGAWDKWYEGWLLPTRITGSVTGRSIPQSERNASAFQLLDNPGGVDWSFNSHSGTGQYFLVENRQKVGFDAGLPGCGLLIWHVDESVTSSNKANANESHRLVDLEQADGLFDLNRSATNRGDAGDPYPGSKGKHTFNRTSTPNSNLYGGAASGVYVLNISSCGPSMTADLAVGPTSPPAAPKLVTPANGSQSIGPAQVLDWADSPGATYYQVEVRKSSTTGTIVVSAKPAVSTYTTGSLAAALYYWRARACNLAGCSAWSAAWSFRILAPSRPTLLSPATNTPAGPAVSLDWSDSPGATYYQVLIRKDSTTGLIVFNQKPAVSAIAVSGLSGGHWYYWHVRACSTTGCSAWTAWWRFKLP